MKKVFIFGLALISTILLVACGDSNSDSANSSSSTQEQSAASSVETVESTESSVVSSDSDSNFVNTADEATFDGTILKGNSYSVKITDYKVIQPGETGNEYGEDPVIAFWYDTLVADGYDGSTDINPTIAWIMNFTAIQDNDPNMINELNIASLPDSKYQDSQTATIKPGGTVSNAVAYTLSDSETPVTLTAGSMLGKEFGSKNFDIK